MAEQNNLSALGVKLQKTKVISFLKSELESMHATPEMAALKATEGFSGNAELKKEYSKLSAKLPKVSNEAGVYLTLIMNNLVSEVVAHANELAKTNDDKSIRGKYMCNSTPGIDKLSTYQFLRRSETFMAESPELDDLDNAIFKTAVEEQTTYKCIGAVKYLTVVGHEILSHCIRTLDLIRNSDEKSKITLSMARLMTDLVLFNSNGRERYDELMTQYSAARTDNTKSKLEARSEEQKELSTLKKKHSELKSAETRISRLREAEAKNAERLKQLQSLPIQTQPELENKINELKTKLESAKKGKADATVASPAVPVVAAAPTPVVVAAVVAPTPVVVAAVVAPVAAAVVPTASTPVAATPAPKSSKRRN